jgi:hypothetical protein
VLDRAYVDATKIHDVADAAIKSAISSHTGILGSPAPRQLVRDRSRYHGSVDHSRWYAARVIELAGRVRGDTVADAQVQLDAFKKAVALGIEHVFKFRRSGFPEDERCVVRVAQQLDVESKPLARTIPWTLVLLASDPRIYGDALKSGSYDPTAGTPGTGIDFPIDFPIVFGTGSGSQLSVSNQGNFETPPVFTITGPVTTPIIDNDTTGESIYTKGLALLAGETAVVDVAKRTLTIAGVSRPDYVDAALTVWFELVVGTNLLRLRGSGMSGGQTQLAVSFRDARI